MSGAMYLLPVYSCMAQERGKFYSFNTQSVLRQVHSLFHSEFFTEGDLVLPLAIYSIVSLRSASSCLRLPSRLLLTSVLPSIFPSMMGLGCLRRQVLRKL